MSTLYILLFLEIAKTSLNYPNLPPHLALLFNAQWLKLLLPRTNFYGPKDVQAIEAQLYQRQLYKNAV